MQLTQIAQIDDPAREAAIRRRGTPTTFVLLLLFATSSIAWTDPTLTEGLFLVAAVCGLTVRDVRITSRTAAFLGAGLVYVLANIAPIVFGGDNPRAVYDVSIRAYLVVLAALIAASINYHGAWLLRKSATMIVLAGLITVAFTIIGHYHLIPELTPLLYKSGWTRRTRSTFQDPNVAGAFLTIASIFALYLAITSRRFWGYGTAAILLSVALFMTLSRAAMGSFAIGITAFLMGVYFVTRDRQARVRATTLALGGVSLGSALLIFSLNYGPDAAYTRMRFNLQDYDNRRFAATGEAFVAGLTSPLGHGAGSAVGTMAEGLRGHQGISPHNTLAKLLYEAGLIGTLAFGALIAIATATAARIFTARAEADKILQIAIIVCITTTLINSWVVDALHWRFLFLILGLALASWTFSYAQPSTSIPAAPRIRRDRTMGC